MLKLRAYCCFLANKTNLRLIGGKIKKLNDLFDNLVKAKKSEKKSKSEKPS